MSLSIYFERFSSHSVARFRATQRFTNCIVLYCITFCKRECHKSQIRLRSRCCLYNTFTLFGVLCSYTSSQSPRCYDSPLFFLKVLQLNLHNFTQYGWLVVAIETRVLKTRGPGKPGHLAKRESGWNPAGFRVCVFGCVLYISTVDRATV